jgi:hypothetical protein
MALVLFVTMLSTVNAFQMGDVFNTGTVVCGNYL